MQRYKSAVEKNVYESVYCATPLKRDIKVKSGPRKIIEVAYGVMANPVPDQSKIYLIPFFHLYKPDKSLQKVMKEEGIFEASTTGLWQSLPEELEGEKKFLTSRDGSAVKVSIPADAETKGHIDYLNLLEKYTTPNIQEEISWTMEKIENRWKMWILPEYRKSLTED